MVSSFFSAAKAFFRALSSAWHSEDPSVHYPLRMGLARRRWCVYWPPKVAGTGSIFRAASPNQKSRHHDMKTGKGTFSSGVFTSVSGLFFNMWQERPCFCTWRPFLTSAPALSLANTCVEFPVQYQHRCSNSRACSYGWAR